MMEESVLVAKECGRTDEVRGLALGAAQLYREHGAPASALYLLKRAAKILENKVCSWLVIVKLSRRSLGNTRSRNSLIEQSRQSETLQGAPVLNNVEENQTC